MNFRNSYHWWQKQRQQGDLTCLVTDKVFVDKAKADKLRHEREEAEFKAADKIWNDAKVIFKFDVLISMFRYTKKTISTFFHEYN
jgi:hypothetical protein